MGLCCASGPRLRLHFACLGRGIDWLRGCGVEILAIGLYLNLAILGPGAFFSISNSLYSDKFSPSLSFLRFLPHKAQRATATGRST